LYPRIRSLRDSLTQLARYIGRMRIVLLGSGEAFDETLGNTSALVHAEATLLLDCGYAAPFQLWHHNASPDLLDAIYISHAHADHYFGLPALLARMGEDGRTRPLALISQKHVLEQIGRLLELGYAGISAKLQFAIQEIEASPSTPVSYRGVEMHFAPTVHAVTNLAVRIEAGRRVFCYSGDGMFTRESRTLFQGANLLLHEAYSFDESRVHADIPRLLEMADQAAVEHLVLTHVQRAVRKNDQRLSELRSPKLRLTLAEPGDEFELAEN
jgi:ribonuclease BN (tRNA processing enzyme)